MKKKNKDENKVGCGTQPESDEARGMRESIEEMERELTEIDRDIADAKRVEDSDIRETAVESLRSLRKATAEMIASNKELYKTLLESEALEAKLAEECKQ